MAAPYGGKDKILGKKCSDIFPMDNSGSCPQCPHDQLVDGEGNPTGRHYSWDWQRAVDGQWFRVLNTSFRWVDGRLVQLSSSINITENKDNESLIRKMAEHDPLTSMYNRRKFIEDIEKSIIRMRREGVKGYLLFIDLDDFKRTNDTLGHLAGDTLLVSIGKFLQQHEKTLGTPYRYGGDEFVMIAENKTDEDLYRTRDILLEQFSSDWSIQGHSVRCGISIGAAIIPQGDRSAADLVEIADMAMYEVKKSGKHGFKLG
jgi:diguanylate cyclase (GGDEF)-like protein